MATINYVSKTYSTVTCSVTVDTPRSGLTFQWYYKISGGSWTYYTSSNSDSYTSTYYMTYNGLSSLTWYDFNCEIWESGIRIADLYLAYSIQTDAPPNPRPSNWYWDSTISSGSNFNISATEWNNFTSRINQFRQYKYLTSYSFYTVSSGEDFYYWIFNQAVSALNDLSSYMSVNLIPSTKQSGDDLYASYFINMRDSLNSIS